MASFTIEQWLQGSVDFNITDTALKTILFNNGVPEGSEVHRVTLMQRELCLADLLMWLASSSVSSTGELMTDGGWQHQKSAKNVSDRAGLRDRALFLYRKWNSDKADNVVTKINMKNLY